MLFVQNLLYLHPAWRQVRALVRSPPPQCSVQVRAVVMFIVWLVLSIFVVIDVYSTPVTTVRLFESLWSHSSFDVQTDANRLTSTVVKDILGDDFSFNDTKWRTTFKDITSAGDFYNWLRGPVSEFLWANTANRAAGTPGSLIPQMIASPFEPPTYASKIQVDKCLIRQVRSKPTTCELKVDDTSGSRKQSVPCIGKFSPDMEQTYAPAATSF